MDPIPIPVKALIPTIPRDDRELQELAEDLRVMGCEGLLAKPWNLQSEDTLREFKYEWGNQWVDTKRTNPDSWTPDVWNRVYKFPRGILEGWVGRRDGLFAGNFRGDTDPKEGFHPGNCKNRRERRVLELLLPILNPDKPKQISLTMANTMSVAMSWIRPVNWGLLIHEVVGRALPHIGRKPSFLSPFILHLYHHYDLLTAEEEDRLTIASDEVTYKLHPETGESETSSDPIVPKAPPSSPRSPPPLPRPVFSSPSFPSSSVFSSWSWTKPENHVEERGSLRLGFSDNPFKRV